MARTMEVSPYITKSLPNSPYLSRKPRDWQAVWLERENRKLDEAEKEKSHATLPRHSDR